MKLRRTGKMLIEGFVKPIREKLNAERLKPKAKI